MPRFGRRWSPWGASAAVLDGGAGGGPPPTDPLEESFAQYLQWNTGFEFDPVIDAQQYAQWNQGFGFDTPIDNDQYVQWNATEPVTATFISATSFSSGDENSFTFTPPAGMQVGDLMVATITGFQAGTTAGPEVLGADIAVAGWTQVDEWFSNDLDGSATDRTKIRVELWAKVATAGDVALDPQTVNLTQAGGTNDGTYVQVSAWRGPTGMTVNPPLVVDVYNNGFSGNLAASGQACFAAGYDFETDGGTNFAIDAVSDLTVQSHLLNSRSADHIHGDSAGGAPTVSVTTADAGVAAVWGATWT